MELRNVNQNLVPILRALLREQSVSRAADTLGLMQPAVSAALGRLRGLFDDPLLIRRAGGMALTPRARELIQPVEQACEALEGLWRSSTFDPLQGERRFRIAHDDYGPLLLGPALLTALAPFSRGLTVQFTGIAPDQINAVRDGQIDGIIVPARHLDQFGQPELPWVRLLSDAFVAVVGAGHRLATNPQATREQLADERCVVFSPGVWSKRLGDFPEVDMGMSRGPAAFVHSFAMLPMIAATTDCVAIMPWQVAIQMRAVMGLTILEQTIGPAIDMVLVWSPLHDLNLAHRWFRDMLCRVAQRPGAPSPPAGIAPGPPRP